MKAVIPENKRDQALVAQGRAEVRSSEKKKEKDDKIDELKKERNAARRDAQEAEAEAEAGRASHRLVMGLTAAAGTGGGIAAQHYGMDKTSINAVVKKGTIPAVGIVLGSLGLMLDGIAGAATTGFFYGMAFGSGSVSVTKKVAGIA